MVRPSLITALGLTVSLLVACGDDEPVGGGGTGNQGGTGATAPGGGGEGGSGAVAGNGGMAGAGGAFAGCQACVPPFDICVDEASCSAGCPAGRARCDAAAPTSDEGPWDICCAEDSQCCPGAINPYCAPANEPCGNVCADGTVCPSNEQCELDPPSGTYSCTTDCTDERSCGAECCPLGSQCENGTCPLPDLSIDTDYLIQSTEIVLRDFSAESCSLQEGCVGMAGERKLLRFSLRTPNTGDGDLFLGDPSGNTLFEYSTCHDHYHFTGYAEYRLIDSAGQVAATGHKQAFCLLDYDPLFDGAGPAKYTCQFQGIQKDWSDIYESTLPCQWVDITGVPGGDYQLEVRVNFDHILAETDFTNNDTVVPVTIPGDSCPNGCRAADAMCCAAGDPCGWGADGSCDCGGFYSWDAPDCSECLACETTTTCIGGCTLNAGMCCDATNPCNLDNNDVCDCEGAFGWDSADCLSCVSDDPECANVDTCPEGCSSAASQPQCCQVNDDVCGYANDGWCDCSGTTNWDSADCSNCLSNEPDCP